MSPSEEKYFRGRANGKKCGRGQNPFLPKEGHPRVEIEFVKNENIAFFNSYLKIRPKIYEILYFYMKSYIFVSNPII